MRVFRIEADKKFVMFDPLPFNAEHDESTLEDWLEKNSDKILEDSPLLVIGRQVRTSLGGYIDLLGVDGHGDLVIVELKRDRTPRETVAQALEYASYIAELEYDKLEDIFRSYIKDETLNLTESHRDHFSLDSNDAVSFNKDQRLVLVGQRITPEIRKTARFLGSKGVRVTCVEFTYFQSEDGEDRLMTQETVVDDTSEKLTPSSSVSKPPIDAKKLLQNCDDNGKAVFSRFLDWSKEKEMVINWGSSGCSLNVRINNTNVGVLWMNTTGSPQKHYIYVGLKDKRFVGKSAVPDHIIEELWENGLSTGFFDPTEQYLRHQVTRKLTEEELDDMIRYCESVSQKIREYGLI